MRRRPDQDPEARLRWERDADWQPAVHATEDLTFGARVPSAVLLGFVSVIAIVIALFMMGCPPREPEVPPSADGGDHATACERACERMRQLGCEEAEPTPRGESCESVCTNALAEGQPLDPECVSRVAACDGLASCQRFGTDG